MKNSLLVAKLYYSFFALCMSFWVVLHNCGLSKAELLVLKSISFAMELSLSKAESSIPLLDLSALPFLQLVLYSSCYFSLLICPAIFWMSLGFEV